MKKCIITAFALLIAAIGSLGIATQPYKANAETMIGEEVNPYVLFQSSLYDLDTELEYTTSYVYTPNGTQVPTKHYAEISDEEILFYNYMGGSAYSGVELLSTATSAYNCHSYAWYQSMTTNQHWMSDPSAYYTDGSYYIVSQPQAGDIICYFTALDENIHSGVVIDAPSTITGLDTVLVESKWSFAGLYRHTADNCPYSPEHNPDTAYVRFYRHAKHTYNQECEYVDERNHRTYCLCGDSTLSLHAVRAGESTGRYASCIGCGAQLDLWSDVYPVVPYSVSQDREGSYILPNGIAVIADEDMELFERGNLVIDGHLIV